VATPAYRKIQPESSVTSVLKGRNMKIQLIVSFTKVLLVLAGISACPVVLAQSPIKACVTPPSNFSFTVSISGPEVRQVKNIGLAFSQHSSVPPIPGQEAFLTSFGSQGTINTSTPGVFNVTVIVPEYLADGEYKITRINIDNGTISLAFTPPSFVPPDTIKVCNSKRFGPLKIDSVIKNP
jgi:uncharacterized lipoprotein YajG